MATKIVRAGLNYDHLKLACDRNGFDGLVSILSEKVNGVTRVTKSPCVIQQIFDYFSEKTSVMKGTLINIIQLCLKKIIKKYCCKNCCNLYSLDNLE